MTMKSIKINIAVATLALASACSGFLDRESQSVLSDEEVFSDQNMVNSVLANYYGRVNWGQNLEARGEYQALDEGTRSSGARETWADYSDGHWRVYDYTLIRHINQFLQSVRSDAAASLDPAYRKQIEGEARFLRAWTYFNMGRCMGGMPIVGDEVFTYVGGMDITAIRYARSTEAALYDYIIDESTAIAAMLPAEHTQNAARANKWAALTLKARAAVYAASNARYGQNTPEVKTSGGEVGIPADKAAAYYRTALEACREIIDGGRYKLYDENPDRGANFYEAIVKKGNDEVIWARDYIYPGNAHGFSNGMISTTMRGDIDANDITPTLNLVEAFEYVNDRDGTLRTWDDAANDYVYYDRPEDLFADKDPRLYGTVVYPGSDFNGVPITYQAGQKYRDNGEWKERVSPASKGDTRDDDDDLITSENGPDRGDDQYVNNSGFNLRKFVDYNRDASTRGRGSDIWFVRMRYAEVLVIAAEAALELGRPQSEVCGYLNQIRARAGISPLSSATIDDIIRERQVEFAYENHRWWDLRRLRRAHVVWNGNEGPSTLTSQNSNDYASGHYALFPYRIKDPSHPQNGKWVFDKLRSTWTCERPHRFQLRNYYNFIDQNWINNNPKYVKNPYQ